METYRLPSLHSSPNVDQWLRCTVPVCFQIHFLLRQAVRFSKFFTDVAQVVLSFLNVIQNQRLSGAILHTPMQPLCPPPLHLFGIPVSLSDPVRTFYSSIAFRHSVLQVTLRGSTQAGPVRGSDNGERFRPDGRVLLTSGSEERIIRMFGTASDSSITSIGFNTTSGRTFMSPWGVGGGQPFSVDGLLLGFSGALDNGVLSGIAAWYTPVLTSTPGPVP
jgi:hypothetical protein